MAKIGFSIYQVNKKNSMTQGISDNNFKKSFQELKLKKRYIKNNNDYDGLPGLGDELLDRNDKDIPADQLSQTIMEDTNARVPVNMLSFGDKVRLWASLLLYAFGRAAMQPIMLEFPQPPAFKMFFRCLLVVYSDQE